MIPRAGENVEQLEPSQISAGDVNGTAALGNNPTFLIKL